MVRVYVMKCGTKDVVAVEGAAKSYIVEKVDKDIAEEMRKCRLVDAVVEG